MKNEKTLKVEYELNWCRKDFDLEGISKNEYGYVLELSSESEYLLSYTQYGSKFDDDFEKTIHDDHVLEISFEKAEELGITEMLEDESFDITDVESYLRNELETIRDNEIDDSIQIENELPLCGYLKKFQISNEKKYFLDEYENVYLLKSEYNEKKQKTENVVIKFEKNDVERYGNFIVEPDLFFGEKLSISKADKNDLFGCLTVIE